MDVKVSGNHKIILGVDPGTNILGYSIISTRKSNITILLHGIIRLDKTENHFEKLRTIFLRIDHLIRQYRPAMLAIEAPFYGKNIQSMLKLGRAQGAVIVAAASHDLSVTEYSPRRIKQSITGRGNASKEQVAGMLKNIFRLEELPESFDETDALATAVCHAFQDGKAPSQNASRYKSWKEYARANAGKIPRYIAR